MTEDPANPRDHSERQSSDSPDGVNRDRSNEAGSDRLPGVNSDHQDAHTDPALIDSELRDATADGRRHELPGTAEWPVLESSVEYETGWFLGGYDLVELPDGRTKRYYWAELPAAVVVIARTENSLLFVEQYRPTIRETQLELPAGIVEAGESYTTAAARELEEETGFRPGATALLETVWCTTGLLRHRRAYVFASGLEPGQLALDSNEFLDPKTVPISEAMDRVRSDSTNDATLEGLLLAETEGLLRP